MKKLLMILIIGIGLLGISAPRLAQGAGISDFERLKASEKTVTLTEYEILMIGLVGAYEGMGWVTALLFQEGRPEIFCPPDDYLVSVDDLREMLDEEIRVHTFSDRPYPEDSPMEAIVMFAARARFPCP